MIPKSNERHLMLNKEVVEAVREGRFHIWSVETIEQGIEILTGMTAGVRGKSGKFPKGTLYHLVDERLKTMGEKLKLADKTKRKQRKKTAVAPAPK
ncbi:MAG: hypothetical protein A2X79_01810 [Desulfuromonadaceae bacterium GWB2_53_15]|nr:MAG: hypothetical protein A2X79_01810 [Desulfuromonadaceae bacterium GWB2_53_15]